MNVDLCFVICGYRKGLVYHTWCYVIQKGIFCRTEEVHLRFGPITKAQMIFLLVAAELWCLLFGVCHHRSGHL